MEESQKEKADGERAINRKLIRVSTFQIQMGRGAYGSLSPSLASCHVGHDSHERMAGRFRV